MTQIALAAFTILVVTMSPLGAAPVFVVLTRTSSPAERRRIAVRATLFAGGLLTVFALLGDDLLRVLGISLSGVRIGGGVLLMLMAVRMVFGTADENRDAPQARRDMDVAVFPLAMPMIAGPATITSVVVLMSEHQSRAEQVVIFAMLLLVLCLTLAVLLAAGAVASKLEGAPTKLLAGIMGMLLMALAADFVARGLRDSLFG